MKCSCGGCDSIWTGAAMAHCGLCHKTFSTVANYDRHRVPVGGATQGPALNTCWPPQDVGLQQNARGTWRMPDERDLSELYQLRGKK